MTKRMILNETSYFGPGAIKAFLEELKNRNFSRVLVVTDAGVVKAKIAQKITKILACGKIVYKIFDRIDSNPTIANVRACVDTAVFFRADCIVAVGGGSVLDAAKAVAIICKNPEFKDVRKLEGFSKTKSRALPLIAVSTTSGSGSEASINYAIYDEDRQRKFTCIDPHGIPLVAIVDSDFSAKVPQALCAQSGAVALVNAIEGYITKNAHPVTDMYCLEAIKIIGQNLKAAVKGSEKAREQMSYAQYIAALGFSNSGLGLANAMAHPLSALYEIPHGLACAALIEHALTHNAQATGTKMKDIALALGAKVSAKATPAVFRKACITAVEKLLKDAGISKKLSVTAEKKDLEFLTDSALKDVLLAGNPKEVTKKKIMDIYKAVLKK